LPEGRKTKTKGAEEMQYDVKLMEKYGAYALEQQLFFNSLISKEMIWNVDIYSAELYLGHSFTFPIQILGTYTNETGRWIWMHVKELDKVPSRGLMHAAELRKYGVSKKLDFLKTLEFRIKKNDLHFIGLISMGITGSNGYYLGNYGKGTVCLTVQSDYLKKKFVDSHEAIFTTFPKLVSVYDLNDKEAFKRYMKAKQYDIQVSEDEIFGQRGEDKVRAIFDESRKLSKLEDVSNVDSLCVIDEPETVSSLDS
jgi:hypothetical protein